MIFLRFLGFSILACSFIAATHAKAFDHSHKVWSGELKKYQNKKGLINYRTWQKKPDILDTYLGNLSAVKNIEFDAWTVKQQKAFLVNAYNAFTIKLILKNYPVKSIKKIGGLFTKPWDVEFFTLLEGKIKTLDPIEHKYLRKIPKYKDPRIHAAVNCASISCPQLWPEAFVASKLDQQLDEATQMWLKDKTRNQVLPNNNTVEISKIFDWFEEDFGGSDKGVLSFLSKYSGVKLPTNTEIDYMDYDWKLNEQ